MHGKVNLAVIGTGRQAQTQVDAVCRVRKITELRVCSRDPANRDPAPRQRDRRTRVFEPNCAHRHS